MLTIDIGNTRIKWAVWLNQCIIQAGSSAYLKQQAENAFACWAGLKVDEQVIVACVAGDAVENALTTWMQHNWSVTPIFLRTTTRLGDVTNAYQDPSQHGVDRWAALLGAHALYHQPVCIIDAGTAVTVDLMNAEGRHLGGLILPGLEMMRGALLQGTAGIHQTDGDITVFANNTADAVSSGTLHMLRAAIMDICSSAAKTLGNKMRIIITGGMSEQILSLPGIPQMQHEPELVLHGLRVAAEYRAAED
jgi:type III pantothenate kinase